MYPSEGALYRAAAADQDVARSFDEVGSPPQLERQITLLIVALAAPAGCAR